MNYIFLLETYSNLVLNNIYELQLPGRSLEEVLFLALPTSLLKFPSR